MARECRNRGTGIERSYSDVLTNQNLSWINVKNRCCNILALIKIITSHVYHVCSLFSDTHTVHSNKAVMETECMWSEKYCTYNNICPNMKQALYLSTCSTSLNMQKTNVSTVQLCAESIFYPSIAGLFGLNGFYSNMSSKKTLISCVTPHLI